MSTATALTTYPAKTDDQHDRIYQAFQYAAAEGWLKREDAEIISYLQLQPDFGKHDYGRYHGAWHQRFVYRCGKQNL